MFELYNYSIDTILKRKLSFEGPISGSYEGLIKDRYRYMRAGINSEIEAMVYFLFKAAYERDIKRTAENVLHYHDFDEFLPIGGDFLL